MSPRLSSLEWAIIWPARQEMKPWEFKPDGRMGVGEGFIETNKAFCEWKKGVYWDHNWPHPEVFEPVIGYIYDSNYYKQITHKALIEKIVHISSLSRADNEYIPHWRKQCFKGRWPNGDPHNTSPTWFKIIRISELQEYKVLPDFERYPDREPYQVDHVHPRAKVYDCDFQTIDGW